jgi:hypothetical protein
MPRGGSRSGAGRPMIYGPTILIRIPQKMEDEIKSSPPPMKEAASVGGLNAGL